MIRPSRPHSRSQPYAVPDWYESVHSDASTRLHSVVVHEIGVVHSSVHVVVVSQETGVLASGDVRDTGREEHAARKMSVRFTRTHRLGAQEVA